MVGREMSGAAVLYAIPYPVFDPVIIEIGPFALRWYALAYVAGLILGWRYMRLLAKGPPVVATDRDVDDFLIWATLGVVVGGRLGFVLFSIFFYEQSIFIDDPLAAFQVWKGGMAFHGGLVGVIVAIVVFCRVRRLPMLAFGDLVACATPIGLFLGRIANFINGELWGRVSDAPWAMVFPHGGPLPRHPSQLYEAVLEGLVLFIVLLLSWRRPGVRARHGLLTGMFLVGYGIARAVAEHFRDADPGVGFLLGGTTTGQWFSLPMVAAGVWLMVRARPRT
jgi:phosphatidylglycerol:prolipoprotein diacylglycerol transferase